MNFLLDTNILFFCVYDPDKLKPKVRSLIEDMKNTFYFSSVSIWEVAIKAKLGRENFDVSPYEFRHALLQMKMKELVLNSEHALCISTLPDTLHQDPFDRILIAQSRNEGFVFITHDKIIIEKAQGYIHVLSNR